MSTSGFEARAPIPLQLVWDADVDVAAIGGH